MRVVKYTITKKLVLLYLILPIIGGCSDSLDVSQGPCPFPPGESNFPVISQTYCDECYFKIQFRGEEYFFQENQLETRSIIRSEAHNSFFSYYFAPPSSVEELYNSIGVKTPLLKIYTIIYSESDSFSPAGAAEFGMYNYCKDLFEPITGDVSQSWHQLTTVELIESYLVESDSGSYQFNKFYSYGELEMTFLIDGVLEEATANYKLDVVLYEKL